MTEEKKQSICPVERAGGLDNSFRKLLQNPKKLLKNGLNGNDFYKF